MVNTKQSKKVLFRLKAEMKKNLNISLAVHEVGMQHLCEAFIERFIAEERNPQDQKFIVSIVQRAKELQNEKILI